MDGECCAAQGQHRARQDEVSDRCLFAAQARDPQVQPALEQDHSNGEIDDRKEAVPERSRTNPAKTIGTEQHPKEEQDHDPRKAYVARDRLTQHPGCQRENERECCVPFHAKERTRSMR